MKYVTLFVLVMLLTQLSFSQKMYVHTHNGIDSMFIEQIDSITFSTQPPFLFSETFENGYDPSQLTFEGDCHPIVDSQYHAGSHSLLLRGADSDPCHRARVYTTPILNLSSCQIEFWFQGITLGSSSGGGKGHVHIEFMDTTYARTMTSGQSIAFGEFFDYGDSLLIMSNNGITKCGVDLRALVGWHKITGSFTYSGSQATVIVSVDGIESVRSTVPFTSACGRLMIEAGGQNTNTSQVFIDDLTISGAQ